jgi:hypothetical protein
MTKKTKSRLPKTIAGVKVPKALRDSDWANGIIHSDAGRKLLADALMAAAGAAAAAILQHRPSAEQVAEAGEAAAKASRKAAGKAKDKTSRAAGKLADTVLDILPGTESKTRSTRQDKKGKSAKRENYQPGRSRA